MSAITTRYFIRGCGRWCPRNILRLSFRTRSGGRKIEGAEEEAEEAEEETEEEEEEEEGEGCGREEERRRRRK